MKVAFLTNFIPPYLSPFFKGLSVAVGDLTIFVSTKMEPNRSWQVDWKDLRVIQQKNVTVERLWRHPEGFSDQLFIHLPFDTLIQLIRFKPKVIVSAEIGFRTFMAFLYKLLFPSTRFIIWARVSIITEQGRGRGREWLRKLVLPKADAIIVNGKSGKEYIEGFGISDDRIHIVRLPVDNQAFIIPEYTSRKYENCRLLYVGQIIPRKGLVKFIDQLSAFLSNHPEYCCELWIIGEGPQKKDLEKPNALRNFQMRFIGNVEYSKMPEFYHQANAMIFPTLADEWGYVVNEAMASQLPVFGSKYSQAVDELIMDNENGWVYDPLDEENTIRKLEELFATPPERLAQMGENAFYTIKDLDISFMVRQFYSVIMGYNDQSRRISY